MFSCSFIWQIVIPNVLGMVLYQPSLSTDTGVSPLSERFCRSLVARYPMNVFDHLVGADRQKAVDSTAKHADESVAQFFILCSAAGAGQLEEVGHQ